MSCSTKKAATCTDSGIIRVDLNDFFNSASWKRTRQKALAHDPLKGAKHIAKAPPSPNQGSKASERIAKRANFFVGQVKTKKVAAAPVKTEPKSAKPKKVAARNDAPGLDYFNSPAFIKARKKALAYDPLKSAKHTPKVPPVSTSRHASILKNSKLAKRKPVQAKPQPGLAAAYVSRPGQSPVFEPVQVVKNQTQLNAMLRKGNIDLLSAIAYCDRRGQLHTGSVLEIYSMLPA